MSETPLLQADGAAVLSLPAETQFAPQGIVSRTLLNTEQIRLVLFGFDAGQRLTEHTSPHHAMVQMLTGRCRFTVNGETHELKPGDLLTMPPGAPHAVEAPERFSMLLTLSKA